MGDDEKVAEFFKTIKDNKVKCTLCPRDCVIIPGEIGACNVRKNVSGKLIALTYGFPCSLAVDPIEKKPLYHFFPGEKIFSVATAGCNLFCKWCQNSEISHPMNPEMIKPYGYVSPEEIINHCKKEKCELIAFTYTEPTIFYEYMIDIAKLAKKNGIKTVIVSNGYINSEPLKKLIPFLDAANIDLKSFDNKEYLRWSSAKLNPVLETLKTLKKSKVHLEITTLIVPGVNDDKLQLEELYSWVEENLGQDQVVHISRFFPYYKAKDLPPTSMKSLELAEKIAKKHVNYVYIGNVGGEKNTVCQKCGEIVIKRGFRAEVLLDKGKCSCGNKIAGVY